MILCQRDRIVRKPFRPGYIVELAREMRKNPTPAERALWNALREKEFFGYHLRRQAPFGRYVFDIYCAKKKIAFEIDGDSHEGKEAYDEARVKFVGAAGVTVYRFNNSDIIGNINQVLDSIKMILDK